MAEHMGTPVRHAGGVRFGPPGDRVELKEGYELRARYAVLTFWNSQLNDVAEFQKNLALSVVPQLSAKEAGGVVPTVEIIGCREGPAHGWSDYHVLLRFTPEVHWKDARKNLEVKIEVGGEEQVDTRLITIWEKPATESVVDFVSDVAVYMANYGGVFGGTWSDLQTSTGEVDSDRKSVERVDTMECVGRAECHVSYFEAGSWCVTEEMQRWYDDNFGSESKGQPTCLVLVGVPRAGKSEWTRSWGRPVGMSAEWNVKELLRSGATHLVLDDINWKTFAYKRAVAQCAEHIPVVEDNGKLRMIKFGLPVIITSNEDSSPLKDESMEEYLREANAVVVDVGKDKMYVDFEVDEPL